MSDRKWELTRQPDERPFRDPRYGSLSGRFPRVALVMPVGRGSLAITRATVATLHRVTRYPAWTLVSINDAAGDDLDAFLASVPGGVLIRNATRRSFAQNTNAGFRAVEADYYIMLNNDVIVSDPYWLHRMVALAESDERIAVVGAGLNSCGSFWYKGPAGTAEPFHYFHVKFFGRGPFECQSVGGFNMMIRAAVMKRIGLLDEGFFPAYGEETDFCLRAVAHGYRVMDCLLPVYHVVRGGLRGKLALPGADRLRYSNTALGGSARRLALRWGPLLPAFPPPTYREAVEGLRRMAAEAPGLLPLQSALPPTCGTDGAVDPLFGPAAVVSTAKRPFTWRGLGTDLLIQGGRALKLAELLLRGRYDQREWE